MSLFLAKTLAFSVQILISMPCKVYATYDSIKISTVALESLFRHIFPLTVNILPFHLPGPLTPTCALTKRMTDPFRLKVMLMYF